MAKKVITTITCDICGRKEAVEFSFRYDRRGDAAGGMENVYYRVDVCSIHSDEAFRLHGYPFSNRERLVGRSASLLHGSLIKEWIEQQITVWGNMSPEERRLALDIEDLEE